MACRSVSALVPMRAQYRHPRITHLLATNCAVHKEREIYNCTNAIHCQIHRNPLRLVRRNMHESSPHRLRVCTHLRTHMTHDNIQPRMAPVSLQYRPAAVIAQTDAKLGRGGAGRVPLQRPRAHLRVDADANVSLPRRRRQTRHGFRHNFQLLQVVDVERDPLGMRSALSPTKNINTRFPSPQPAPRQCRDGS